MSLPPTDTRTVQAAIRGDADAWHQLLTRWLPQILAWSRRLAGPDVDAEDIAHDAWIRLMQRAHQLRDPDAFGSWAYQVTRDVVRKQRERRQRWTRVVALLPLRRSQAPLEPDVAEGRRVLRLLQQLPEDQREALVLCLVEERSRTEAAQLAGVPVGTLKSRLRLGTRRFRELARAAGLVTEEVATWSR